MLRHLGQNSDLQQLNNHCLDVMSNSNNSGVSGVRQDSSKEDAELKDGPLFALKRGSGIPLIRRKISFSSKRGMDF